MHLSLQVWWADCPSPQLLFLCLRCIFVCSMMPSLRALYPVAPVLHGYGGGQSLCSSQRICGRTLSGGAAIWWGVIIGR